ncbi:DUF805 domain-containing protein [Phenylobacterium sp. 58.2.17]|uniref:DUF805 domain-containing protein n=1 Tax=Phenylobacterium sp. 58.2.17 TaxID=2969306 RepID=UPI0022654CE3|nr:DUF805 domain-containing protein [Phenylobacterium sp. 58.2.17]MCX7587320.1 DUF805 domain-containing protein [Phenylobacterium sp. 58.2.17]
MSDEQANTAVGTAERRGFNPIRYLKGRAGRKEYWIWFGVVCALGLIMSFLPGEPSNSGLAVVFAAVQIRRLHDYGRSGWWVAALFIVPLLVPIAAFELGLRGQLPEAEQFARAESWSSIATVVAIAGLLAVYVWMGLRRGDTGDNRFGPPPASDLKSIVLPR